MICSIPLLASRLSAKLLSNAIAICYAIYARCAARLHVHKMLRCYPFLALHEKELEIL